MIPSSEVFRPPRACSSQLPFPKLEPSSAAQITVCCFSLLLYVYIRRSGHIVTGAGSGGLHSDGMCGGLIGFCIAVEGRVETWLGSCSGKTYIDVANGGSASHIVGVGGGWSVG